MRIYTKTGDAGETGLFGGPRVRKDDTRIEAFGEVDELNSVLGCVRSAGPPAEIDRLLDQIQNDLFDLGAELATPDPVAMGVDLLREQRIADLEAAIDQFEAALPPLKVFILPGGSPAAAGLHLARAVARRAERQVVRLMHVSENAVSSRLLRYLNRLSDLLFVLARATNQSHGIADVAWRKREPTPDHKNEHET